MCAIHATINAFANHLTILFVSGLELRSIVRPRVTLVPHPCSQFPTILFPSPIRILLIPMGDPSFSPLPFADAGVVKQSPPPFLPDIRPFLQAPPYGSLPSPVAFVSSLPVAPHAEAQGQPSFFIDTGGLSCQVSPLSVGQFPYPSTVAFAPASLVPLSSQSALLP